MKADKTVLAPRRPRPRSQEAAFGETWQAVQDRLLKYLKASGVRPLESLEIALEVMRRLASEVGDGSRVELIPEAMRIMHRVLEDGGGTRLRPPAQPQAENSAVNGLGDVIPLVDPSSRFVPVLVRRQLEPYRHVRVMPPINRSAMRAGNVKD
ncbi:MAG: hypothetical protein ACOWWM_18030 [Desulfobacterales bacterium]